MKNLSLQIQKEIILSPEEEQASAWIETALIEACEVENLPPVEVSLLIVDNEQIRKLNANYRAMDRPTDVLSFPLWEMGEEWEPAEDGWIPLGDIVISMPKAQEQAKEYGHSLERELGFLGVHGFLHLLGYDHETESEEREMFRKQSEILELVGLSR